MYTLYKITNNINGKVYIGITKHTVEKRWYCHLRTAFTKAKDYKFSRALRKYGKDPWTKEVLQCGIPEELIEEMEIDAIREHDSVKTGYNTSEGGHIPKGIAVKKGILHHSTDKKLYNFYSLDGRSFVGTKFHFTKKFGFKWSTVNSQLSRNQFVGKLWTNDLEKFIKHKEKLIKKARKQKTKKKKVKPFTKKVPKKIRDRRGENNPMFGVKRPDYVKAAVAKSNKARADSTTRNWVHSSGIRELNITNVELRDKYGLNISHLKRIADEVPKYKTHKGWRLL